MQIGGIMKTKVYAVQTATTPLLPYTIDRRDAGKNDVKYRFVIDMATLKAA
jgi:hypothetical protein